MIQRAYKFRIYPNKAQMSLLNKTFGATRYAWNQWVENFNKSKELTKEFKTPKQFKQELTWMSEISSAAIQQKEQDFFAFKQQFFSKKRKTKLGRPAFKSRRNKQSYRLPNQKFDIRGSKIRLEKIGLVKTVFDRSIPQNIKFVNCTISKDLVGEYFVSIIVEEQNIFLLKTGKSVGIDLGLKSFAVLSTGWVVDAPEFFRENQSKLTKLQQHLARKDRGSNRYHHTKRQVASQVLTMRNSLSPEDVASIWEKIQKENL